MYTVVVTQLVIWGGRLPESYGAARLPRTFRKKRKGWGTHCLVVQAEG